MFNNQFSCFTLILLFLTNSTSADNIIAFSTLIVQSNLSSTEVFFAYNASSRDSLETTVLTFCEENKIYTDSCVYLMEEALRRLRALKEKSALVFDIIEKQWSANLNRHDDAYDAERISYFRAYQASKLTSDSIVDYSVEKDFNNVIVNEYNTYTSNPIRGLKKKVCFIHSTSLANHKEEILQEILYILKFSLLLYELDKIWILNYGIPLQIPEEYSTSNFPQITWIQRSYDITKFEIPTIRHLHYFSKQMTSNGWKDIQVLYLHTKGVSYDNTYQQIVDWRNFMLYFMVEKHKSIDHLFQSDEFDIIGSNYISGPRQFQGNMWWGLSSYLSKLPELAPNAVKYEAEYWVLQEPSARMYVMYFSRVNHYKSLFPRCQYDGSNTCADGDSLSAASNNIEFPSVECVGVRFHNDIL